jgi:hypothetical protein
MGRLFFALKFDTRNRFDKIILDPRRICPLFTRGGSNGPPLFFLKPNLQMPITITARQLFSLNTFYRWVVHFYEPPFYFLKNLIVVRFKMGLKILLILSLVAIMFIAIILEIIFEKKNQKKAPASKSPQAL